MADVNTLIDAAQAAKSKGDDTTALDLFQQVLAQHPNEASLLTVCGNLSMKLNRFELAANHFRNLLAIQPSAAVTNALCHALQARGNQAAKNGHDNLSESCFAEALQHQADNGAFWYNLGNAQRNLNKLEAAAESFQKSIIFQPEDANAYNNLGNVQRALGRLDLAIGNYKQAIALDNHSHHALTHLIHQRQHICDWRGEGKDNLNQQITAVREAVKTDPQAAVSPFAFLAMPGTTMAEQKQCATQYAQQQYQALLTLRDTLAFHHQAKQKPKLNIGYLSADFRLHPLAFLITELIEQHDRTQFEITAYSYGAEDQTDVRQRLIDAFDHFVDIRDLNDSEAATRIYQDGIDILVDLTGYTQSSRTALAVLRPAPIQINWLGFPGTMGALDDKPVFDYILADNIIAPNAEDFSEAVIHLPCYQPNNQRDYQKTTLKSDHNLPDESFVFCCFNQTFKITPDIFAIWMQLLKANPNSVLWLLECNQWAKRNLQKEATLANINPDRLIFAERVPIAAHLARQQHADLFLDTLPYNAHTTASDALSAGLPVLTCKGDTFAARVSASLLNQIGLSELVCNSLTDYEEKALYFATNPASLAKVKQDLNRKKASADLFNAKKFAQSLESQYHAIWQTYLHANSHSDS